MPFFTMLPKLAAVHSVWVLWHINGYSCFVIQDIPFFHKRHRQFVRTQPRREISGNITNIHKTLAYD